MADKDTVESQMKGFPVTVLSYFQVENQVRERGRGRKRERKGERVEGGGDRTRGRRLIKPPRTFAR